MWQQSTLPSQLSSTPLPSPAPRRFVSGVAHVYSATWLLNVDLEPMCDQVDDRRWIDRFHHVWRLHLDADLEEGSIG